VESPGDIVEGRNQVHGGTALVHLAADSGKFFAPVCPCVFRIVEENLAVRQRWPVRPDEIEEVAFYVERYALAGAGLSKTPDLSVAKELSVEADFVAGTQLLPCPGEKSRRARPHPVKDEFAIGQ